VIGAATGLSETRVREIAQGKQRVGSVEVLERIADGLEIDRGWVGLAYTSFAHGSTRTSEGVESGLIGRDDRVGARVEAAEAFIMAVSEESAAHGRAAASDVSGTQLSLIETALDEAAIDLLAGPVMPVVRELRRIRDEAFLLLAGRPQPRRSRSLYAVAAKACGLLATVAADRFRLYDAASQGADAAAVTADLADEPALDAWAAAVRSSIFFWQGRYRGAAATAQAARSAAPPGVEAARLACLEARAWAKLGRRDATGSALDAARRARDQPGPAAGVGLIAFPASNQVRLAGTAHLWLGDITEARAELAEALKLLSHEYDSRWHIAAARVDLAVAHLRAGGLEEAAEVLAPLASVTDSASYLGGAARRTGDIVSELSGPRYAGSALARRLVEEVTAFARRQELAGSVPTGPVDTGREVSG